MATYFLVRSGEDGTDVEPLTENDVLERIESNYYGSDLVFLNKMPDFDKGNFYSGFGQPRLPENAAVLIKGEIVVPKPVEVVKKYELP